MELCTGRPLGTQNHVTTSRWKMNPNTQNELREAFLQFVANSDWTYTGGGDDDCWEGLNLSMDDISRKFGFISFSDVLEKLGK